MTPGLKACSKKQQSLYKISLTAKTIHAENKYKNYRKILQKTKRASKKAHYYSKCQDFRSNTKNYGKLSIMYAQNRLIKPTALTD